MTQRLTILECSDCAGSIHITDKMFDERYILSFCPYCGLSDIELDIIDPDPEED
jgi:hypothetical protein